MKQICIILLFLPILGFGQGMWLPNLIEKQNEKDMKALGLLLNADDLYHPENPSIKDAICMFDGGCTGEMISPSGLLLTNHHCGFDAIQKLSSLQNNYVDDGYWAKSQSEELPAQGVTAMFVVRMEDITVRVLNGVAAGMNEKDRQSQIDKNIEQIKVNTKKEKWEDLLIRPMYNGNQYYLFVTVTYKDIRLVGAPPSSIGKFGADTDNWVWPRHTGDFSIFRIYADKDNHPADFSAANVPFKPSHFLPISLDGVEEDDFSMVYGFPGRTDEYLSAAGVQQIGNVLDPAKVAIRDKALKIMDGFMRQDPAIKIAYIAKYASIANAWKKWMGEMQGLKTYKAIEKKNAYETEFKNRVSANPDLKIKYGNLLPRINQLYKEIEPHLLARDYYSECVLRNAEIFSLAAGLNSWIQSYKQNGEGFFASKIEANKATMEGFYKDYRPSVDQAVVAGLLEIFAGSDVTADSGPMLVKNAAEKSGGYAAHAETLFSGSVLTNKDKLAALMRETPAKIAETLINDPIYTFWKSLQEKYIAQHQPKIQELQPQINMLQRQYMAAQMEIFKEKRFFPDANSTLRITYGPIRSYSPRDAIRYEYQTDLDGVMEKYIPGDYEFDLPSKLIKLWESKDYGQYATGDGRLPVAFIGANHTTGGNSGSPALDGKGNLIGLNFDRVWEGTMSDLNYDVAICRNIMVDARYILFIVDKYGGASHLIKEMKLVKGQKKKKKKRK